MLYSLLTLPRIGSLDGFSQLYCIVPFYAKERLASVGRAWKITEMATSKAKIFLKN